MGHLDRNERVIEAKLTDLGRQRLAEEGGINVTQFALADDEVDYDLWQDNVPTEDAGAIIENIPTYEVFTDETQSMRYKLITLEEDIQDVPAITIAQGNEIDLDETDNPVQINPTTQLQNDDTGLDQTLGYTAILKDDTIATLGTLPDSEPDVTGATIPALYGQKQRIEGSSVSEVVATGFDVAWDGDELSTQPATTTLTIIGNETGLTLDIEVTIRP